MRIAVTLHLLPAEIEQLQPCAVIYGMGLCNTEASLAAFLVTEKIDLLIADRRPSNDTLQKWRSASGRTVIVLIAVRRENAEFEADHGDNAITVTFNRKATSICQAIAAAEKLYTNDITARGTRGILGTLPVAAQQKVVVIGAGIVSLMTAFHLHEHGYAVQIIEQSGDPRLGADWLSLGCTHGGENARMFSLTECDNYHDKEYLSGVQLHGQLNKSIADMGWRIGKADRYSDNEEAWVHEFEHLPICLADLYNEDIFDLNHESLRLWQELIATRPKLFESVEYKHNLLRVASTKSYHEKQLKRQKRVRSYIRELNRDTVIAEYPSLANGCRNGEIFGGIEVAGFTVNVHNFVNNLITHLVDRGVEFRWNAKAKRVIVEDEVVSGILVDDETIECDHYFVSPGVYSSDLLDETESKNKVHGMLGAWISFPNLEPRLQRSLKIAREGHIASSGNIIPAKNSRGEDILIFGSGFGYVGRDVRNIDPEQLDALFASMEDYIEALFPEAFRKAEESGELKASRRYCIRPWTASSLGVFEIKKASNGILVVASGHNTGGFAQSTSVARATADAIRGRVHPMHTLYHPRRFDAFWPINPPAPRPSYQTRPAAAALNSDGAGFVQTEADGFHKAPEPVGQVAEVAG